MVPLFEPFPRPAVPASLCNECRPVGLRIRRWVSCRPEVCDRPSRVLSDPVAKVAHRSDTDPPIFVSTRPDPARFASLHLLGLLDFLKKKEVTLLVVRFVEYLIFKISGGKKNVASFLYRQKKSRQISTRIFLRTPFFFSPLSKSASFVLLRLSCPITPRGSRSFQSACRWKRACPRDPPPLCAGVWRRRPRSPPRRPPRGPASCPRC